MRKIKITALLLAVLMIVTAFAGCASKSTVTNLDNKVNDLDASIEEQKTALSGIESTLATISKALENQGSSDNLDEVIKDVEENEKNVADLTDAIKDLQAAIDDLKKPAGETPATPDDVKVAATQYSAKLEKLEGDIEDDKANYTAESLVAIRELIGDAEAAIANAADAAGVKAVYDKLVADLAAYPSVNGELYAYVVALKGNITDESAAKVAEAEEALKVAIKFYEKNGDKLGAKSAALKDYEISESEDIDLVDAINELIKNQEVDLVDVKNEAAELNKKIAAIDASYSFEKVSGIVVEYKMWARKAGELSPKNVELVKNYDKLMAAQASSLNTTAAKALFEKDTVVSKLAGSTFKKEVLIFADYDALKAMAAQVVFTYDTEDANGDVVLGLTSEIYAAIDAKIAAWQKEYELIDDAVEYVIDSVKGDNYYAKYKSDRALVNAFEDEYEKLVAVDGVFTAIKALNNKRLDANAVEVALAYEKNAWTIENWRAAKVDAYIAELTAEGADAINNRNISDKYKYATVLQDNFNAMVEYANLCQYNGNIKSPEYGIETVDQTTTNINEAIDLNEDGNIDVNDEVAPGVYVKSFRYDEYTGGFKTLNDAITTSFYYELYDFSDAKLVDFILIDYSAAKAAAKAINKKIENYKPEQATSIRSIVEGIGGYAKLNATGDKILAIEETDLKNSVAAGVTNIAQFEYVYNTTKAYDLTSLLNVADYEAKIAQTEKHIKAASDAASVLNDAYGQLVGNKSTVLVTMDNVAKVNEVYGLYTKWLSVGRTDMDVATLINTTATGVNEYKLANILVPYTFINDGTVLGELDVKSTSATVDTGMIVKLTERAKLLAAEAKLVLSAYEMLDKVYEFNKKSFSDFEVYRNAGFFTKLYNGTRNDTFCNGIVSLTVSESAMTDDGKDAAGRSYKKDMYLWTVEYVQFDDNTDSSNMPVFKTNKHIGYYYGNDTSKLYDVVVREYDSAGNPNKNTSLAKDLAALLWKNGTAMNQAKIVEVVLGDSGDSIGKYVADYDIADMKIHGGSQANGEAIPAFMLATFALALEARFELDNYGEYAAIEDAKKAFDPANGGYGFNFVKGITYQALENEIGSSFSEARRQAVIKATDIESLRVAANAAIEAYELAGNTFDVDIIFGGANGISHPFDIEKRVYGAYTTATPYVNLTTTYGTTYDSEFGLDVADFKVDGIVIYNYCAHTGMASCVHKAGVCTDCGETVSGTVIPQFDVTLVSVGTPFNGYATGIDLEVGCGEPTCTEVEDFDLLPSDANKFAITNGTGLDTTVDAGDVVTFNFTYYGTVYTITATFDGTDWISEAYTVVTP